jgi:hypothetical protein
MESQRATYRCWLREDERDVFDNSREACVQWVEAARWEYEATKAAAQHLGSLPD